MTSWVVRIDEVFYPDTQRNWDDTLFRERVLSMIGAGSILLDLGAGSGRLEHMDFRGVVAKVCGVDLDPRVESNLMLDEARVADVGRIPYEDDVFDLVFADNVLEHLETPEVAFAEVRRVLKPAGMFLFKTPNKWHYMPALARLTPHRFHQLVNRIRGREERDTFETRYKANSVGKLRSLARQSGLEVVQIERIEGRPEYMRITGLTYLLGLLYERIVNATEVFAPFRILLIGQMQKPPRGGR